MRKVLWAIIGIAVTLGVRCPRAAGATEPELLLRWQFIGTQRLSADPEANALRELWSLPASRELRDHTLRKLAEAVLPLFGPGTEAPDTDRVALAVPLFEDLLQAESFFEMRGGSSGAPDWLLAVRLDPPRAEVWRTNLHRLATGRTPGADAAAGWSARVAGAAGASGKLFAFTQAGGWTVLSRAAGEAFPLREQVLGRLKATGRPDPETRNSWLKTEINLPRLQPALGLPAFVDWPGVALAIHGKDQFVRTEGRLHFDAPGRWTLEPWTIPVHTIHDPANNPLTSFLAVRGFAHWLSRQPIAKELALTAVPNQGFLWSHSQIPFQTYFGLRTAEVTNTIHRLAAWLPNHMPTTWVESGAGEVRFETNATLIYLPRVPFVGAFLRPAPVEDPDFLMGGLLPESRRATNPPPAELLREVTSRTNLVCYEWEVTEARVLHWRAISQLVSILANQRPAGTNDLSQRWIESLAPNLGNTVTVVTQANDHDLDVVRKSRLGLSSWEIVLAAYWLTDPAFPALQTPAILRPSASLPVPTGARSRRNTPPSP